MFRFEHLKIWKQSIDITDVIFDLAESIEAKHYYRFADQMRGAVLSISNNITEGSGSSSKKDFMLFLNYTHRPIFETVNKLIIAAKRGFISCDKMEEFKNELEKISKMVSTFSQSLPHKSFCSPL